MAASVKARVRYGDDLHAWSLEQAALLRARRTKRLDWDHLAEELKAMVGRDRGSKTGHQLAQEPPYPATAHEGPAAGESQSSSTGSGAGLVLEAYPDAVEDAVDETRLSIGRFPADCPYAAGDVLADTYLPDTEF